MAHCFSLFTEGKNPWAFSPPGDAVEDAFSARISAWYVGTPVFLLHMPVNPLPEAFNMISRGAG